MVRTSTAERHNYICPECGDELKQDVSGRGYVAHVSNPHCSFERGQKDDSGGGRPGTLTQRVQFTHQPTDGVQVVGYSERGIFNSLLYEIGLADQALDLLGGLLRMIRFPGADVDFTGLEGAEILVEQSLSDFGDADVILLLHGASWRRVIFIEGKVKPSQVSAWRIEDAWKTFLARKKGHLDSSNLFTQLYHKVRFITELRTGGIEGLVRGVPFPECSTKTLRKLGSNPVVRDAAEMIGAYAGDAAYVALVPDSAANLDDFFARSLSRGPRSDVTGWSTAGWGYLNWMQVEDFCNEQGLTNTLRVFRFNEGQLY